MLKWQLRSTVVFPARRINDAIDNACAYTAFGVASEYRDYLLLRFSEPKTGREYDLPDGTTYIASAPGEYPAIRYGILYRSMTITEPIEVGQHQWQVTVGAMPFPGMTWDEVNNPWYARELEGIEANGRDPATVRPYFQRAMNEVWPDLPAFGRAWFLECLYNQARRSQRRVNPRAIPNVAPGTRAEDLLRLLGRENFRTISQALSSGQARSWSVRP